MSSSWRSTGPIGGLRRNKGKSDTIDAESAARKVLSGEATAVPKSRDGNVERIRILRLTRRSAVVAQGQASNQMHALIATAPDDLREQLRELTTRKRVAVAARFRPDRQSDPILATTKLALKKLARRFLELDAEIKELSRELDRLVEASAPTPPPHSWSPPATTLTDSGPRRRSPR